MPKNSVFCIGFDFISIFAGFSVLSSAFTVCLATVFSVTLATVLVSFLASDLTTFSTGFTYLTSVLTSAFFSVSAGTYVGYYISTFFVRTA